MLRFNPPPNWPQPPLGWVPPEGWQPDPAWGPAPLDWSFWTDESPAVTPLPTTHLLKRAPTGRGVRLPWWVDVKYQVVRFGYWLTLRSDAVAPRYEGPEPLRGRNDTTLRVMPINRYQWPVLNVSELEWITRLGESLPAILSHGLPNKNVSYQVAVWAGEVPSLVGYLPSGQSKRVAAAFQEAGLDSVFGELRVEQEKISITVPGLADPVFAPVMTPIRLQMAPSISLWQRTIPVSGDVERIKLETTGYEDELRAAWFMEGLAHPSSREAAKLIVRLISGAAPDEVAVVAENGVILGSFENPALAEQIRRLDEADTTMTTRAELAAKDSGFNLRWELRIEIPQEAGEVSTEN